MVAHAFLSGYVEGTRKGMDFRQAIEFGDLIAQRTQASFLTTDLAPVFRDTLTASALQFQNTINGVFNFIKFDIPQSGRAWRAAASFIGTFVALAAIYDYLGLPRPDRISEFIPGLSTMRSGGGPVSFRLIQGVGLAISGDPRRRAEGLKSLESALAALIIGPGGNQLRKIYQGIKTVQAGGKRDKRGRLLFPVSGAGEATRAIIFGPYQTKTGQDYIRRGFKPVSKKGIVAKKQGLFDDVLKGKRNGLFDDILKQ